MVYQADRQVTLLDVLAEAGGITPDAGESVIITRLQSDLSEDPSAPPVITPQDAEPAPIVPANPAPQPEQPLTDSSSAAAANRSVTDPQAIPPPIPNTITVNLNQILETGDTSNNIVLVPGDVVTVPHAGIVYALGAVNRPGGFAVSNDRGQLTTLKLLALAGGLINTAKSGQAVIVRKDAATGQQHQVPVDLKKVMNFEAEDLHLLPSDILYVPKSATRQALLKTAELAAAIGTAVIIYRLIQ
jgi:protein involved in polysaccharide export with SLBB domain